MTRRTQRVGEQIRAELARLLREEATDPRIGLVTLTRVDVAPDLSNARVFWSALSERPRAADEGAEPDAAIQAGLDSAAGFLRSRLAHELRLRRMPELHFLHDPSLAAGAHTLALLRELRELDAERAERPARQRAASPREALPRVRRAESSDGGG